MPRVTYYRRLEPLASVGDLDAGFAAVVRDPVWMLARQWQLGEHQGEDAASPVRLVAEEVREVPLEPFQGMAHLDPKAVPIEPMIEAEPDSWWTMGRRVRIGARVAESAAGNGRALPEQARFQDHRRLATTEGQASPAGPFAAPPYEQFVNRFDGLVLWRRRGAADLNLPQGWFGPDLPPVSPESSWQDADLFYEAEFESARGTLRVRRHTGGNVDWYSADLEEPVAPAGASRTRVCIPEPLRFPGAPLDRWWAIEDAKVDIGGMAPDRSHFPTLLLIDLICGHSRDWFLARIPARIGHVLTVGKVTVFDSFGEPFPVPTPEGWSLFKTTGLPTDSLVVWPAAENPLVGPLLEQVQFGIDEYANLLWAAERRALGCDVTPGPVSGEVLLPPGAGGEAGEPRDLAAPGAYQYLPAENVGRYWHPYVIADGPPREFVQARFRPFPDTAEPLAVVLKNTPDGATGRHRIRPAAIPASGLELVRRYSLARDVLGNPWLWVQRERRPLLSPPSLAARFDVVRRADA